MDANRWATLQTLLYDALDLPEAERAAFVAEHAGNDPDLAAELHALLGAADDVPAFLDAEPRWSLGADDAERDLAGQRIGPYRLVRELGRGGQGRVFLAERDDVGTRVALKLLRGGLASPDLMPRFLRERRVLAGLDHPHIARLLDAGTVETDTPGDATPYFVMEAVEGIPLTAYVQAQPLGERLRLFLQVCDAVDFAHRQLVVHRDLKPTNILVTEGEDGTRSVKLLDFGIAKLLNESEVEVGLTQTGHRLMTPEYAAPEQVLGQPITVATDVYALGVVLYEMLAGVRPYDTSGGLRDVVRAVCDEMPVPPSSRVTDAHTRRDLQGDLDTIVGKALAKAPAERYDSVRALAEDIERYREGRPVQARRQTARYRMSRFLRRHALAVGAALLVVLVLGGAVARETSLRRAADAALAESEAALVEAQASRDLMRDAFGATAHFGQSEIRADTARAITLVDYAARLLDDRWDDQPILKARLMGQLYHVYTDIGHPERGLEQLEAADSLLAAVNAPPDERVEIARWRGYTLMGQERCEEAMTWFRASRRFAEAMEDPGMNLRGADIAAASALQCLGRDDEALALYRRLHETGRLVPPSENLHTGYKETLINYGYLLYRIGRPAEAIPVLQESSDLFVLAFPPGTPSATSARLHLAQAHRLAGDLPAAERVLRRTLSESTDRVGEAHYFTVRVRADLARVLLKQGQLEEADALSAMVPEPAREASEILPARLAYALEARVRVLTALGRPSEAEALAREALAFPGADYGSAWYQRANLPALAEALRAQGRQAEAEAVLRELAEVERDLPPAYRVGSF